MVSTWIRNLFRPAKRAAQALRGRDFFFRPDIQINSIHLGSEHGGWTVPHHLLSPDSIVYSAGIGIDISFDRALINQFGLKIHAFDPTPKSLEWLESQTLPENFHYHPWGFADHDGETRFHIPRNPKHVSCSVVNSQVTVEETISVPVRRIKSIMNELGHDRLDLLKMDIEGAEYTVLSDLLASPLRPTLLLVEFHHRFYSIGAKKTREAVSKLRKEGYRLYAISPTGEELCFIHPTSRPLNNRMA